MNTKFNFIKENNNICFICLDKIDYYIKFECNCHNYLHENCVNNIEIKKCLVCHKIINFENGIDNNLLISFIDIDFITLVIEKIYLNNIVNYIFSFFHNDKIYGLILYLFVSMLITFLIILPIVIISVIFTIINYIKNNFNFSNLIIFVIKGIILFLFSSIILCYILSKIPITKKYFFTLYNLMD
jgi:hypothetical protein